MSITISPELETTLRSRAEAEGLSIEAYLQSLLKADQAAEDELEALMLEGLHSGEPIEITPGYWEEKHRQLEERLKQNTIR